jgi:hypothetical protein
MEGDDLDEVVVALVPFAAEAVRLAAGREVPDETLAALPQQAPAPAGQRRLH